MRESVSARSRASISAPDVSPVPPILTLAAAAGGLLLTLGASATPAGDAAARAIAAEVTVAGAQTVSTQQPTARGNAVVSGGRLSYPSDGSVVSVATTITSVSTDGSSPVTADASAGMTSVSLFGGEIAASAVSGEARSVAGPASAAGEPGRSAIEGLTVLGRPVQAARGERVGLGRGTPTLLAERAGAGHGPSSGFDEAVTALDVVLTAAHGGPPAGSEIRLGAAEARTRPPLVLPGSASIPTITVAASSIAKIAGRSPTITPKLGERGYVFPVVGHVAFGDTFGAARGDVSGGWHHGDDVFAPLGTPVVAVAHGVVFSVGWEKLGGWRLWLRDDVGNEFYYAHLSAYSSLAVNGAIVNAGDVLGFVGDTGDAEGTPSHLHFEVHPVGLLGRGYDGAVDPTRYLDAWRRLEYVGPTAVSGLAPRAVAAGAPKAGAILLRSTDISSASGLDLGSLAWALGSNAPNQSARPRTAGVPSDRLSATSRSRPGT